MVCYLVFRDQVTAAVYRRLHIVTAVKPILRVHPPRFRVRQKELRFTAFFKLFQIFLIDTLALTEFPDCLFDLRRGQLFRIRLRRVVLIQLLQIFCNMPIDSGQLFLQNLCVVAVVLAVDRPELRAVHRQQLLLIQSQLHAKFHKCTEHIF
ncbi:hypothetical protein SDC9_209234 [bioreactor metagenome]|uniref:Uncharacterized protein n=1 Tax=bioreactor metagenome TaxID=1076179 RepID=A0A645JDU1_9ZZZZ